MITFKQFLAESLKRPEQLSKEKLRKIIKQAEDSWTTLPVHLFDKLKVETLGSGAFAYVGSYGDYPYVFKLFRSNDTGYKRWLQFCFKHPNNKYIPKFKGRPVKVDDWYVIRMERLIPDQKAAREFVRKVGVQNIWDPRVTTKIHAGTVDKDWKEIATFLKQFEKHDLHDENIMKRPNGQLVITDPIAYDTPRQRNIMYESTDEDV